MRRKFFLLYPHTIFRLTWYCKGVKRRIFTLNIENWHVLDGGRKKHTIKYLWPPPCIPRNFFKNHHFANTGPLFLFSCVAGWVGRCCSRGPTLNIESCVRAGGDCGGGLSACTACDQCGCNLVRPRPAQRGHAQKPPAGYYYSTILTFCQSNKFEVNIEPVLTDGRTVNYIKGSW